MIENSIINADDRILVTGAGGFIGSRVVAKLQELGLRNIVSLTRTSGKMREDGVQVVKGNLLSPADCEAACKEVAVIYHLASSTGGKSFADAYMNSVITTRNLMEASLRVGRLRRLVLVSSFTVYTNRQNRPVLDETCPTEQHPELRGDAYCFAKTKQEEIVREYAAKRNIPYVIVRPGSVYGPGKTQITGRVGLGTFGLFLHMGGSNKIPLTYVDNCADAIVLAGLAKDIDGEVFNIVDDDLPSSRQFLRFYKRSVRRFPSIYLPHAASLGLCYLWEKYSAWSQGQLPPVFNRRRWYAEWRKTGYSNQKLKAMLGWSPMVSTAEALESYFQLCGQGESNA
jgi:nucleoside-diphosphate-sugar epimerase